MLLGGGLDGVDLERPREKVGAAGDIARRVDRLHARAEVIIDEDAAAGLRRHLDAGAVEPLEIGADARGHDDDVGEDGRALLEGELSLALPLLDLGQGRPRADGDAVVFQPAGDDGRAGLVHHARQDAGGDLDDGEGGAPREDGVQDGEGDEARAHHDDLGARLHVRDDGPRLVERPEGVDARSLRARNGRPRRARARGDQAIVVGDRRAVIEGQPMLGRVERGGPAAEHGLDAPGVQRGGGGRVDVGLRDRCAEVIGQDHARIRALPRDQGDLRGAVFFPERPDGIEPRGAPTDDQVPGGHQACSLARTRLVREAAKSPIQSADSPSSNVMAWVGQASAQAGAPSQRLHL